MPGAIVSFTLVLAKPSAYIEGVRVVRYESVEQDPLTARRLAENRSPIPLLAVGCAKAFVQLAVFVEQTAEQIASTNLARLILADNRQPSRSVRCLKPERSMRTMPVVVLDIDPQDLLQVGSSHD